MRSLLSLLALAAVTASYAQTRPHTFDLKHVRWEVRLDPKTAGITGHTTNVMVPHRGARMVALDAIGMKIRRVTVDGKSAKYSYRGSTLAITLPRAGTGKATVAVGVEYSTVPQAGLYFVPAKRAFPATTDVVYSQGEMEDNRNWLPTYDYPDDKATSEGIIDVPKGWSVLSNGSLIKASVKGARSKFHWKIDVPHATYLISLVAGPYSQVVERAGKVPVTVWVPKGLEELGEAAFGKTAPIIDFYGKLTGQPYPYSKYAQSAVPDFMFGGMENISCTTQTISAIFPKSASSTQDSTGLVAHELAHQWFGDYVTTSGWSDIWINEGWATFLPNFYFRERDGQEAYEESRYGTIQGGIGASAGNPSRPMVYSGYRTPLDMFDGFAYPGGASRMFMLMDKLGEDRFWKVCAAYLKQKGKTSFNTQEFFRVWSKESGEDLTPFMQQWFFTPGLPTLSASYEGANLVVKEKNGKFSVDVPVWIWTGNGWSKKSVSVTKGSGRVDVGTEAGKPFIIDPEVKIMASVEQTAPTFADRLAMLNAMTSHTGKLVILDQFMNSVNPEESLQVLQAPALQSGALFERWVGRVGTSDAAVAQMVDLVAGQDAKVRLAAVRWLGDHAKDAMLGTRLHAMAATESNPVIAQAMEDASLKLNPSEGVALELWSKESYNDGFRSTALSYWTRTNPDVARKRALEAVQKGFPEPTRVDAIRVLGDLKDKEGEQIVFDTLMKVVREPSFGARNTAIDALANYGNPKALVAIQPLTKHPLAFFRNSAESAVARLKRER